MLCLEYCLGKYQIAPATGLESPPRKREDFQVLGPLNLLFLLASVISDFITSEGQMRTNELRTTSESGKQCAEGLDMYVGSDWGTKIGHFGF